MGRESFDRVQHLRHLFDQTLFADACCDNNSRVASMLKSEMMFSKACVESLNAMIASFSGFRNSSKVLQKRVQNAIDMVG